jgi:uncharacterized repeat protein (TIGR03843 family)
VPADERQQRSPHLTAPEWLDLLSSGGVEIEGRLPWSSNYSFLVTLTAASAGEAGLGDGDTGALEASRLRPRAVYKPGRGERPLWDFGGDLYRREVAAYELSAAFELALVPETVIRLDAPLGPGSLQRFVDADFEQHYFTLVEEPRHHRRLRELAGFDVLCNNADRKSGHVLVDRDGSVWGIDNGLSFHVDEKLRTVIWEFAGEAVPETVLEACSAIAEDGVPERVAALIDEEEAEALRRRARALLRTRRLPSPRDDYRAYPWPLV